MHQREKRRYRRLSRIGRWTVKRFLDCKVCCNMLKSSGGCSWWWRVPASFQHRLTLFTHCMIITYLLLWWWWWWWWCRELQRVVCVCVVWFGITNWYVDNNSMWYYVYASLGCCILFGVIPLVKCSQMLVLIAYNCIKCKEKPRNVFNYTLLKCWHQSFCVNLYCFIFVAHFLHNFLSLQVWVDFSRPYWLRQTGNERFIARAHLFDGTLSGSLEHLLFCLIFWYLITGRLRQLPYWWAIQDYLSKLLGLYRFLKISSES